MNVDARGAEVFNASREVRIPHAVVQRHFFRAGAGGDLAPIQQRQLGLIYSAAFGLSALAGDVIELARGGTTLMDQQPIAFSVSDVLQSILDILRPMAEEKRLAMRCTGPTADVRIGHVFATDVRAPNNLLFIARGQPVTPPLLLKIRSAWEGFAAHTIVRVIEAPEPLPSHGTRPA